MNLLHFLRSGPASVLLARANFNLRSLFSLILLAACSVARADVSSETLQTKMAETSANVAIQVNPTVVTLVTTFPRAPEKQTALIELLISGTREIMSRQPGFLSSSVLRADNGHVINY